MPTPMVPNTLYGDEFVVRAIVENIGSYMMTHMYPEGTLSRILQRPHVAVRLAM